MSPVEREHITSAFSFELAKVTRVEIRQRVLNEMLAHIDAGLAAAVAANIGLPAPAAPRSNGKRKAAAASPLLSLLDPATGKTGDVTGRKVAILAADGSAAAGIATMQAALAKVGAEGLVLAARLGTLNGSGGSIRVDHTLATMPSVVFDAVYVPGGAGATILAASADVREFIADAYRHDKPIEVGDGADAVLAAAGIENPAGIVSGESAANVKEFVAALGRHRVWARAAERTPV
jgi:catalase